MSSSNSPQPPGPAQAAREVAAATAEHILPCEELVACASLARDVRRVRAAAAVVAALAGTWLATVAHHWILRLLSLTAWLVALGWGVTLWRSRWAADRPRRLRLDDTGVTRIDAQEQTHRAWQAIQHIEIDEGRLQVVIHADGQAPLTLAAGYGGLGIEALGRHIQRRWTQARETIAKMHER